MDSMSADLMRGLETSLPKSFYFDSERFGALLVSSDSDGAENYLSEFTNKNSNYQSNLMFYLVHRQRYCKYLFELVDARAKGYTLDVAPFANDTTSEMFQMLNHLVATNPDLLLHKKDMTLLLNAAT